MDQLEPMDRMISLGVGTVGAEDYFITFQDISELARNLGETHPYVSVSATIVGGDDETVENEVENLYYDTETYFKVRSALGKAIGSNAERSTEDIVTDCITEMQNVGILFREYPKKKGANR